MRALISSELFLLSTLLLVNHCECISFEQTGCPTWMHRDSTNSCVCGDDLGGVIDCSSETLTVTIKYYYCIFFSEKSNSTLIGSCPYGQSATLPKNASEIKDYFGQCSNLHRKGPLCGECEDNYSLPVYSYNLGCVKCKNFKYGWLKFITVAFLPLTIFYALVIIFRISATSPTLNGYVLFSQITTTPAMIRFFYTHNQVNPFYHVSYLTQTLVDLHIAVYAIWNLDFFRSFYEPVCVHPNLTYPQVALLDYVVAVYPMLLIFITFILVKMHDNYSFVMKLWRPFHRCLVLFRKQWNIQSSLVNALATFIVLSYIKILNVSFELLLPSRVYNMDGESVYIGRLYYNGSLIMTSKGYRPYLAIAVIMVLIFNILPLLLLAFYPFSCFQRLLSNCCCCPRYKLAFKIFMDAFHGCFEDTSHDYRHFATLYLALRFINLVLFSVFNYRLYLPATSLLIVFTLVLVTKLQPYKNKISNTFDVVYFLSVITAYTSIQMQFGVCPMVPRWITGVVTGITVLIPIIIMLFTIIATVFPKAFKFLAESSPLILKKICLKMTANKEHTLLIDHQDVVN